MTTRTLSTSSDNHRERLTAITIIHHFGTAPGFVGVHAGTLDASDFGDGAERVLATHTADYDREDGPIQIPSDEYDQRWAIVDADLRILAVHSNTLLHRVPVWVVSDEGYQMLPDHIRERVARS